MLRLEELAKLVNGRVVGPDCGEILFRGAASIQRAIENQITLVTSEKYLSQFESSTASAAVVPVGLGCTLKPCIEVENPEAAFVTIVALFRPKLNRTHSGISPQAIISPTAHLESGVCIHAGVVIMDNVTIKTGAIIFPNVTVMENCQIGTDTKIFPGAVLYENTEIGDRCIVHANVVLGAYGFGYSTIDGEHRLGPQLGNVRIGDDVEVGANSTIDRGTYDSTEIGAGTKLDNLVMIGHNCRIGTGNLLCSQVGIAGSCETGDLVVMGGQVGLADHLTIGNRVSIGAQSGVMHDIADNTQAFGSPARPMREEMQILAGKSRLPEMRQTLRSLERKIEFLQAQVSQHEAPQTCKTCNEGNSSKQRAA
jgi:UDP-3-O-[3-hydroxymyristoyl] glucosamine N-acyltransferase